ncbi:peptidoglycan-binding protein LysM, partial [Bradyrhizobium guangdongense]
MFAAAMLLALWSTVAVASPAKSKPRPVAVETAAPAPPAETEPLPQPRVYLFRGAMGPLFSTGMDRLGEKLTKAGLVADVYEFTICRLVAERALTKYREEPAPIVLIGHSMG